MDLRSSHLPQYQNVLPSARFIFIVLCLLWRLHSIDGNMSLVSIHHLIQLDKSSRWASMYSLIGPHLCEYLSGDEEDSADDEDIIVTWWFGRSWAGSVSADAVMVVVLKFDSIYFIVARLWAKCLDWLTDWMTEWLNVTDERTIRLYLQSVKAIGIV